MLGAERPGARVGSLDHESVGTNPLQFLDEKFSGYLEDRRSHPRDDVLTELASAKYPDGSTPEIIDVVRTATFLFAAGQETTAKLLSRRDQVLAERPDVQQMLRDDRSLIPTFIEESLRLESPVKSDFAAGPQDDEGRRHGRQGGHRRDGAARRGQPRSAPVRAIRTSSRSDRANVREHIAFGRGVHSCPGAPLARVEGRVSTRAHAGPDGRHHRRRRVPRPGRRAALQLRADLHPARAHRHPRQVHGLARYASPRTQIDSPFCGAQLRNNPSGACATYDSLPLQLLLNSLTPIIGGERK